MKRISSKTGERNINQNEADDFGECSCGGALIPGFSTEEGGDILRCKLCGKEL